MTVRTDDREEQNEHKDQEHDVGNARQRLDDSPAH
jgi:hypothetical protein